MALPKKVREQAERAEAIVKGFEKGPAAADTPPATPAAKPAPAAAQPPAVDARVAQLEEELARERTKYKVLQGKYDNEVPTLHRRVAALEAELSARPATPAPSSLTDQERETYGPELLAATAKAARDSIMPEVERAVAPLRAQMQDATVANRQMYVEALTLAVPNMEQVNDSSAFAAWLDLTDQATGEKRRSILNNADAKNKASVVVEIFRAFLEKREIGASGPSTLEFEQSPGDGAGAGEPANSDQPKEWTTQEVHDFYNKRGEYARLDEKTRKAMESEIFAAQNSGRLRQVALRTQAHAA